MQDSAGFPLGSWGQYVESVLDTATAMPPATRLAPRVTKQQVMVLSEAHTESPVLVFCAPSAHRQQPGATNGCPVLLVGVHTHGKPGVSDASERFLSL